MSSLDEKLSELESVGSPEKESDAQRFDKNLEEISSGWSRLPPPAVLRLMRLLSDASPFQDSMWTLLHTVEVAEAEVYVMSFVKLLEDGHFDQNPEWGETIACRFLNAEMYRELLRSQLESKSTATKERLSVILAAAAKSEKEIGARVRLFLEETLPSE